MVMLCAVSCLGMGRDNWLDVKTREEAAACRKTYSMFAVRTSIPRAPLIARHLSVAAHAIASTAPHLRHRLPERHSLRADIVANRRAYSSRHFRY